MVSAPAGLDRKVQFYVVRRHWYDCSASVLEGCEGDTCDTLLVQARLTAGSKQWRMHLRLDEYVTLINDKLARWKK